MELYDEEKIRKKSKQEKKLNKIIISSIVIVAVIIIALIGIIFYLMNNPNKITYKLDGKEYSEFGKIIEITENEDKTYTIHAPIKAFAEKVGYKASNGEYLSATTDWNVCNVENEENVSEFYLDSITIRKKDLTVEKSEFENYDISEKVYEKDKVLYTNKEGLEKAFNLVINYDSKKKILEIYTLDLLVESAEKRAINNFKQKGIDNEIFVNKLAILDDMIIVSSENSENKGPNTKYGVIKYGTGETILETKYDKIVYTPSKQSFFIYMNGNVGIIDNKGEVKVKAVYEDLALIDKQEELYLAKRGGLYGIVNGKDEIIVHLEYSQIGINQNEFKNNGLKTGYILLNTLIPVKQSNKWGFFDKKGNKVTELIYDNVGCASINGTAEYGLVVIPNYNYIVVRRENGFTFIDLNGKEIVPNAITSAYIKISSGEPLYYMIIKEKEYNIVEVLDSLNSSENN